jgi:membrane protease YdiL (CAAX protease family)
MMNPLIIIEIFLLFVLPVLPAFFRRIPKRYRLHIFAMVIAIAAVIVVIQRWPLERLGLIPGALWVGFVPYSLFTILGVLFIFALAKGMRYPATERWWTRPHFLFLFIPISVGQEFLYRSFLMHELSLVFDHPAAIILANAMLFAFIHIIYPNRTSNLIVSFLAGICFAGLYYYYPSLILISISHLILNFAATYFGMFSFDDNGRTAERAGTATSLR